MRITLNILTVFGFFLWSFGFLFINTTQLTAQDMEAVSREVNKTLMNQMIKEPLPPGISPENLPDPNSSGAKLLQKYCSQCHNIFSPRMHSAEKWSSVFQRVSWHMQDCPKGERMGRMAKVEAPSPQEGTELLNYLKLYSLQAADQSKLEHLDTSSGMTFLGTCAQCHALPDPKQHNTQEWPEITARMKQNMQFMDKPVIRPREEALIVQYLQNAATQ